MTTTFIEANNVNTSLASAASSSATTLTLASSVGLPTLTGGQQMALTLNDAATGSIYEVTYVTAITGGTLTVLRGQEGTTAQNWNVGDFAFCGPTSGTVAQINGNPNQQFQVAPATATNQAPNVGQIQNNGPTYAADTGAANAYVVALSPAPTLSRGATFGCTIAHANTGASTLALNGGTAYPIWGGAQSPLQGGELAANGYAEFEYNPTLNSGNPVYVLLENTGGALQVSPATQSQHAVQLGQATGRLLRTSVWAINGGVQQISVNGGAFTSTGATTFTPAALTTSVIFEMVGGAGGSGGVAATSTGQNAISTGGSAGAYAKGLFTSAFSGITITVGAPGTAGSSGANNGGNGGTSSAGVLISAPGGPGGIGGPASANGVPFATLSGGQGSSPAGANLIGYAGSAAPYAVSYTASVLNTSAGGPGPLGSAGQAPSTLGAKAAAGYGTGPSGAFNFASGSAQAGLAGQSGVVIAYEYA